jgi:hypothetical protein
VHTSTSICISLPLSLSLSLSLSLTLSLSVRGGAHLNKDLYLSLYLSLSLSLCGDAHLNKDLVGHEVLVKPSFARQPLAPLAVDLQHSHVPAPSKTSGGLKATNTVGERRGKYLFWYNF